MYVLINYDQHICYDECLDVYHCIDPAHHLHGNKIACGAHLHVTPNPKYSRAIVHYALRRNEVKKEKS